MSAGPARAVIRDGGPADAAAIAALHAASWRAHYRGVASDSYLDGPLDAERQAFWTRRLATMPGERVLVLAELGERLAGFSCAVKGQDQRWGTLIDNLHVAAELKRNGLGRMLMCETAVRLTGDAAGEPVHLFVLQANAAARAFYDKLGGDVVASEAHALPDGTGKEHPVLRYAWASPRALSAMSGDAAQ